MAGDQPILAIPADEVPVRHLGKANMRGGGGRHPAIE